MTTIYDYGITPLDYNGEPVTVARLSTDTNGNSVLMGDGVERLVYQSHYASGSIVGVICAGDGTPVLQNITGKYVDTHNLISLVNDVIENPFYGVKDAYIQGWATIVWAETATPAATDWKGGQVVTGDTVLTITSGGGSVLVQEQEPVVASAWNGQTVRLMLAKQTLPSTQRYIGVMGWQVSAGSLTPYNGTFDIEIFG